MPAVYSIRSFGSMMADRRMDAYAEAIRRVVRPGDVVVDIGAGTGIMTLLACRAGASRVHAIETNAALEVARDVIRDNGFADRVTFYRKPSGHVTLPDPVDVIVADLRGISPLYGSAPRDLHDARDRWLKPGGTMVAERDVIVGALVESPALHALYAAPWEGPSARGFDWAAAQRRVYDEVINDYLAPIQAAQILSDEVAFGTLDYRNGTSTDVAGEGDATAQRDGTAHGIGLWFDATLTEGVTLTTSPTSPKTAKVYGHSFLPFAEPVHVVAGDKVRLRFSGKTTRDNYVYSWAHAVPSGGRPGRWIRRTTALNDVVLEQLRRPRATSST